MRKVTLFTRAHCHLCEQAREIIERLRRENTFEFAIVDIDDPAKEQWLDEYDQHVPVIHIDGTEFARHRLDEKTFCSAL